MTDGCYDLDGRCVNCHELHPCRCEAEAEEDRRVEAELDAWIRESEEDRDEYERGEQE